MIAKNEDKPEIEDKGTGVIINEPEFKDIYIPAFVALMLHKLGGMQQITVELLEKFPAEETPICEYNPKNKSWMMKTAAYHKKKTRKRGIIKQRKALIIPTN